MDLINCRKFNIKPLLIVGTGVLLVSAFLFSLIAQAQTDADHEAQVNAAIQDLSSATGQAITSEEQAKDLCNQEQYLDVCADIGKKHDLYTEAEVEQVDFFLNEVKGKILDDIKNCSNEECLIKVANELARKIQVKNPTLATSFKLTTTLIEEKNSVIQAAKEVGVDFRECESMDPDTATIELLRQCAKLAKDSRVQKYIPEERRALADQFSDTTLVLQEGLRSGKYQCGDNTLEGCGNYCLNPSATATGAGIPEVCKQIATEVFGPDGVKQLESAHQQVGQVKDHYSKKFILTLPDGRELVGEGQIRNACDRAFSERKLDIARACGSFAVQNGFANQAEVDKGLKLMESFASKGQDVNFDECLANPEVCRDFIPEDERGRFDAGRQIFEIMRTEIGFDPSQCERGSVDQAIGTQCFEGSKRALAKIESLGLANQSQDARFIIEDIRRHVSEGDDFTQKREQFKEVFNQQGGPGGCKSEAECFNYCSNPTNGPECIAFGAQQGVSGFRGDQAVQKFQEYNQNIQRQGFISDEYRPYPAGGQYPQYPGQGSYPGYQPPGQDPRFTQPGPGFSPPPGTGPYFPPFPGGPGPGPAGPSPECFAAIQSGDFVKAKAVCEVHTPNQPFPSGPVCPASPYVQCPAGEYRESYRNTDGCWVDGPCRPAPTYSYSPYPTYTYSPSPYPTYSGGPYPTYTQPPPCPAGQWWDYTYNQCTSVRPCGSEEFWDPASQSCRPVSRTYSPYPYPSSSQPPGGNSCSQSLINLLGTGCHQMYSDSSGRLVFCDGPMTKSAKEGDSATTPGCSVSGSTPYPSPSYTPPITGSCPSGYHYHSESGGFCMNDQENYSGTCYNSSGTTQITCPAQPSYTPSPSYPPGGNSCSQSLINLLGTGCHQMYSDSSGRLVFCDGPMTKSAKEGDSATTPGCSVSGSTPYPSPSYTPYPSYSPTSSGSCPSGSHIMYVNGAGGYCMSDNDGTKCGPLSSTSVSSFGSCSSYQGSTTSYTPYPTSSYQSCPSGQYWDYATSACKTTSSTDCPSGQYWNGSSCVSNTTTSYTPYPTISYTPYPTSDPSASCASSGGTWNGSSCTYPTYSPPPPTYSEPPPPTSGLYPRYMVAHCQQLGRTWNGEICRANGLFARILESYTKDLANILKVFGF